MNNYLAEETITVTSVAIQTGHRDYAAHVNIKPIAPMR